MKVNIIKSFCLLLLIALTVNDTLQAQQLKTPAASPTQTLDQAFGLSNIKIEYSRPSAKGRVIFGDLVPYGKIWRTGANSSTKITFGDTVKIEGNMVKPGTYSLYTIPNKDNWQILFSKDLNLAGDVANYKESEELFRFTAKPTTISNKVETFTMNISDITSNTANIELTWENTRVTFPVSTDIDGKIMKNIDAALEKDARPYYTAASYYYDNNKDLKKALEWTNTAISQNPKAFYMVHLKAKILNKLKDTNGALEAAQQSIALAKEAKNADYVQLNEKLIAEIKAGK